ncbi:M20/M25/M40 family metallo-hydrolase [Listeria sp. PSOL-1]|uniref:M20/M25/M40 family metallo-hydrolase n=1 Tax=Listeria sp. PSOL-1 TaxID=1844999 RepID=UPI0013D552E3|nr:M20/M25/M40 family metallo-hydrolase [Listeria sp. PSOL-1]
MKTQVSNYFEDMLSFYAPPRREQKMIDYIVAFCQNKQLEIISQNEGGILVRIPETAANYQTLFFNAHLDQKENEEKLVFNYENGTYSASAGFLGADDKAGVAAMLAVMDFLSTTNEPHGETEWLFTTREEEGMAGIKMFDTELLHAHFGYTLDAPGDVGSYYPESKTHIVLDFQVSQNFAESNVSAINIVRSVIHQVKLQKLPRDITFLFDQFEGSQEASYELVKARTCLFAPRTLSELLPFVEDIKEAFYAAGTKYNADIEADTRVTYHGYRIEPNHQVLHLLKAGIKNSHLTATELKLDGGSDANVLNERGFVTCLLSCGYQNEHSHAETITEQSLIDLAELVKQLIIGATSDRITATF